jgi:hypothetical protein
MFVSRALVQNNQLAQREMAFKVEHDYPEALEGNAVRLKRVQQAKILDPKLRIEAGYLLGCIMPKPDEIKTRIENMRSGKMKVFSTGAEIPRRTDVSSRQEKRMVQPKEQAPREPSRDRGKAKAARKARKQNRKR